MAADARMSGIEALCLACVRGSLCEAQAAAELHGLTAADVGRYAALPIACENGHLPLAQWLVKHYDLTAATAQAQGNRALRWACANGHLEVARWLAERFGFAAENTMAACSWALQAAGINGHMEVVHWLARHYGLAAEDLQEAYKIARAQGPGGRVFARKLAADYGIEEESSPFDAPEELGPKSATFGA